MTQKWMDQKHLRWYFFKFQQTQNFSNMKYIVLLTRDDDDHDHDDDDNNNNDDDDNTRRI